MSTTLLRVEGLTKSFPAAPGERLQQVVAVDAVSFSVPQGAFFALLGPSGCGKTTILRCIAGLEAPDAGEIMVGERQLDSSRSGVHVPANERGLGMVFQSYAIWPHMTVRENVAFPLTVVPRRLRRPRSEIGDRVDRMLELVRLEGLASRPATDLSGGQQQRLALARALVTEPPLLLLDEPLSSIDAKLRADMCFELKRLQETLGITTVYVTHDQQEALAMAGVVAVMNEGQIVQTGDPRQVYARPSNRFVAEFVGDSNLIDGVVHERRNGTCVVRTDGGLLAATDDPDVAVGTPVVLVVRAERIRLEPSREGEHAVANRWLGIVRTPVFRGDSIDYEVAVGELRLRVRTEPGLAAAPGAEVALTVPADACVVFPADR